MSGHGDSGVTVYATIGDTLGMSVDATIIVKCETIIMLSPVEAYCTVMSVYDTRCVDTTSCDYMPGRTCVRAVESATVPDCHCVHAAFGELVFEELAEST